MVRTVRHVTVLTLIAAGVTFFGCAPAFPREALDRVNRRISFRELLSDPDKFKGSWIMIAGNIVSLKNVPAGTIIEILQKPMDDDGKPLDTDTSEGRFIVQTKQFLDAAIYLQGRPLTVIGEIIGKKFMPLDEILYQYPLLDAKAIHLWRPSTGPRFFFGISISGEM